MPYVQLLSAYLVAKLYIKTSVWRAFKHYLNPALNFKSLRNIGAKSLTIGSLIIQNPTMVFPKPEQYTCTIPNYWKINDLKSYTGFHKALDI